MSISIEFFNNADSMYASTIYEAMSYISKRSCIRFIQKSTIETLNFIYIKREGTSECRSTEVGRMKNTGRQFINLNEVSCSRERIIHEILHSVGLPHLK
jgi:hypothetical protein